MIGDAVEEIIVDDDSKREYMALASDVIRLYKALLPHVQANAFKPQRDLIAIIAVKVSPPGEKADISDVMRDVEELLDQSVEAESYVIRSPIEDAEGRYINLMSRAV